MSRVLVPTRVSSQLAAAAGERPARRGPRSESGSGAPGIRRRVGAARGTNSDHGPGRGAGSAPWAGHWQIGPPQLRQLRSGTGRPDSESPSPAARPGGLTEWLGAAAAALDLEPTGSEPSLSGCRAGLAGPVRGPGPGLNSIPPPAAGSDSYRCYMLCLGPGPCGPAPGSRVHDRLSGTVTVPVARRSRVVNSQRFRPGARAESC